MVKICAYLRQLSCDKIKTGTTFLDHSVYEGEY